MSVLAPQLPPAARHKQSPVQRFDSAIDFSLLLLTSCPLAVLLGLGLAGSAPWWTVAAGVGSYLPVLLLLFPCYYQLNEDHLLIRCGLLYRRCIPYKQIQSVCEEQSWQSGPALSLDRLLLRYGRNGTVLLSPRCKALFIAELSCRIGH